MGRNLLSTIFILVLILGAVLRLVALDSYPTGFTPDEASFGYDAYSLLTTGKDQWGKSMPLVLESFGDFKPPLYAYLSVPSVALFGLSKFAIRFPNAFLGTLAILVTYLMTLELVRRQKVTEKPEVLALVASFLLAISSWHIMMSRGAFEANITTFLLPLAVYLFLKGLNKPKLLILSSLIFGINLFSYHSARLVTPLIIGVLVVLYSSDLKKVAGRYLSLAAVVFGAFLLIAFYTLFQGAGARFADVNIFNGALEDSFISKVGLVEKGVPETMARFIHNKYTVSADRFLSNYFIYLSPQFWFTNGPAETTYGMIPGRGVFYWFEMAFLIAFMAMFFSKPKNKAFWFIASWILLSPIAAALSTGPGFAANRTLIFLPAPQIAMAIGALGIYSFLTKVLTRKSLRNVGGVAVLIIAASFFYFLEDYFIQSPRKIAPGMLYGNLEVAEWVGKNIPQEKMVIVDRSLSEPHIYFAFAEKTQPSQYQEQTKNWHYERFVDQIPEYTLGRYIFRNIEPTDLEGERLLVGRPSDFPLEISPTYSINYPGGEPAIYVFDPEGRSYASTN